MPRRNESKCWIGVVARVVSTLVRFRILGEDLVAFRDITGTIAFLAESCPHRWVGLWFRRNEERGLRCVYHGWKFDTKEAEFGFV